MMRFIPRKVKVKITLFRNFTIFDAILILLGIGGAVLIMSTNIFEKTMYNIYLGCIFGGAWATLLLDMGDGVRLWYGIVLAFKFSAYRKYYSKKATGGHNIKNIMPFDDINTDKFLQFGDYYGMVFEVLPMSFGLLAEERQDLVIHSFSQAIQRLNGNQQCSIVKTKSPMLLDDMAKYEDYRYNVLQDMADRGLYNESEFESRSPVFEERLQAINYMNNTEKIIKDHFYIVVYDTDRDALVNTVNGMVGTMESSVTPIFTKIIEIYK